MSTSRRDADPGCETASRSLVLRTSERDAAGGGPPARPAPPSLQAQFRALDQAEAASALFVQRALSPSVALDLGDRPRALLIRG